MADRENDLSQGLDTVAQEPSKAMDEAEKSILGISSGKKKQRNHPALA
jgi:hypothetical protein